MECFDLRKECLRDKFGAFLLSETGKRALMFPVIDWLIMTVALINMEEKWLLDLYGDEYAEYKKHVNRCIPWKRKW
jgi:hypothetical protein